jgi:tRNA pseudouridine55 synthase
LKREKRPITGVLLLDKPPGLSSNAALTRAKIQYRAEKAGHTGTLDPFATGLLPLCFGESTKFAGYMLEANKTYEAVVRLGVTTSTGDPEGERLSETPVTVSRAEVGAALNSFTGRIRQVPPMYSALKFQGQPLYALARRGVEVERAAREVNIRELELLDCSLPLLRLRVVCSKGTYIRVLAEDIGRTLGCGGMLEALRRTHSGGFQLTNAYTLEQLGELSEQTRDRCLLAPDCLVQQFPALQVEAQTGRYLLEGRSHLRAAPQTGRGCYRVYGPEEEFYGLVEVSEEGVLRPQRMMSSAVPACPKESLILLEKLQNPGL